VVVCSEAKGLHKTFCSFYTFSTLLLSKILAPLNLILQTESIDLLLTISAVDSDSDQLQLFRDSGAVDLLAKAEKTAAKLKLP
jgi:hypothetical protein